MAVRRIQNFMQRAAHFRRIALGHPGDTTPVYPALHIVPTSTPSGTAEEGDIHFSTDGEPAFHDGGDWRRVGSEIVLTHLVDANSVDTHVFGATRGYTVTNVEFVISTAGGASAAVQPRKIVGAQAPGASAGANVVELTAAAADLNGTTVNTITALTLSTTAADLVLADGDMIALNFSGTLTSLVGAIFITLRPS